MVLDIVIQCITEVLSVLQMGLLSRIWKHTNISYPADFLFCCIFKIITQPHHLSLSLPPSKPSPIFLLPLSQITGPRFSLIVITCLCVHILKYNLFICIVLPVYMCSELTIWWWIKLWQHTFFKIYQNYLPVCLSEISLFIYLFLLFWRIEMIILENGAFCFLWFWFIYFGDGRYLVLLG